MVTTGRTLADGEPVPDTGFEVDPGGELAALLAERVGPLNSHPTRPIWGAPLPTPEESEGGDEATIRSLSILGPGYDGPPEHYHEQSRERFEVVAGEPTFRIDGESLRAGPGRTVTVETGQQHTFSFDGEGLSYMIAEIHTPGRLRHVLPTLGGLAHDDTLDAEDPLQQALIARRLSGNTVFTEPDPRLARPLTAVLAPIARLRGYQGAYAKYTRDAFWERHVEQPDLSARP